MRAKSMNRLLFVFPGEPLFGKLEKVLKIHKAVAGQVGRDGTGPDAKEVAFNEDKPFFRCNDSYAAIVAVDALRGFPIAI